MREVRVHRDGEGRLSSPAALPHAAGVVRGLLRVAGPAAGPARAGGRTTGPRDRGDPRGEPAAVWQPADSRRTGGPRLPDESEARGALDAGPRARRPAPPAVPGDDPLATPVPRRAQRAGAAVRAGRTGSGVGHRHHVHPDGRGLALLGGDPRSLLALGWAMSERITDDLTLDAL